jgi:hypothetical protein
MTPGSDIRDPGGEKIRRQDPGSGMNIPDLIFCDPIPVFWVKIFEFFDADADPDPEFC